MGRSWFPRWVVPSVVGVLVLGLRGSPATASSRQESEPRLTLPGNHVVRPGQWIDLRWSEADSISELEILLSRDGGRHYVECISPRLDPRRCHYVWRVPEIGKGELRMRIRFNRRGQEIEGAPSGPLVVFAGRNGVPEPLGLPPLAPGAGERVPRSPSPGQEFARSAEPDLDDGLDAPASVRRPRSPAGAEKGPPPGGAACRSPFAAPRSTPLRA
jgi:hypothetical protein